MINNYLVKTRSMIGNKMQLLIEQIPLLYNLEMPHIENYFT